MSDPNFRKLVRSLRVGKEAVDKLNALGNEASSDNEAIHQEADQILVDFLKKTYPEIAEAYEELQDRVAFWYA